MSTIVTRDECEQILIQLSNEKKTTAKVQLKDFLLKTAGNAVGFLGDYFYLHLDYMSHGDDQRISEHHIRLFVKSLPEQNTELSKKEIFLKEVNLYNTLLKDLQTYSASVWCPKVYFTRDDLIVLQDLNDLGYRLEEDVHKSFNATEMKPVLRALAALHASSIVFEVKNQVNIGIQYERMLFEITVSPNIAWYETGLRAVKAVLAVHPKYQSHMMQNLIETQLDNCLMSIYDMVGPSKKLCNVLCHRDPWCGNILFDQMSNRNEKSAMLVDFQTCRYCPPCIDVIFTIYMNLSKEERKLREMDYIKFYYKCFTENLQQFDVNANQYLPESELLSSYQARRLFGCVYKILATTILRVPVTFMTNEYRYVDRSKQVIEYMQENSAFRIDMEEGIEDMMELIMEFDYRNKS